MPIRLYRAVRRVEYDDMQACGRLRLAEGLEVKYFTASFPEVHRYIELAEHAFRDGPYAVVYADLPEAEWPLVERLPVDGGIVAIVLRESQLEKLGPPRVMGRLPWRV
jgi:hypothetical protein